VEDHLKSAIKQASGQFAEVVSELSQEIHRLGHDVQLRQNKPMDDRGIFWRDY
jgi:hypothetical protein